MSNVTLKLTAAQIRMQHFLATANEQSAVRGYLIGISKTYRIYQSESWWWLEGVIIGELIREQPKVWMEMYRLAFHEVYTGHDPETRIPQFEIQEFSVPSGYRKKVKAITTGLEGTSYFGLYLQNKTIRDNKNPDFSFTCKDGQKFVCAGVEFIYFDTIDSFLESLVV